jgi:hypothetical protein
MFSRLKVDTNDSKEADQQEPAAEASDQSSDNYQAQDDHSRVSGAQVRAQKHCYTILKI